MKVIEKEKLEELSQVAEAAMAINNSWYSQYQISDGICSESAVAFIATFTPETALNLINLAMGKISPPDFQSKK